MAATKATKNDSKKNKNTGNKIWKIIIILVNIYCFILNKTYYYKITSIGVTLTVISLLGQAPIAPPEFDENDAAPRRLFPGWIEPTIVSEGLPDFFSGLI